MTIQQAIEKAIAGEYRNLPKETKVEITQSIVCFSLNGREVASSLHEILLDPKFWTALGKTEGWRSLNDSDWITNGWDKVQDEWLVKMHALIDALASGKTIEEFFSTL